MVHKRPLLPSILRRAGVTSPSNWRTYSLAALAGASLIVTADLGFVQKNSETVEEMRPGDVVWIASMKSIATEPALEPQ